MGSGRKKKISIIFWGNAFTRYFGRILGGRERGFFCSFFFAFFFFCCFIFLGISSVVPERLWTNKIIMSHLFCTQWGGEVGRVVKKISLKLSNKIDTRQINP